MAEVSRWSLTGQPARRYLAPSMNIDFTCKKCEGSFEIDSSDLIDGTEKLECPHCNVKASQAATDDFTASLTELTAQLTLLAKKFTLEFEVDSEDLGGAAVPDDDEEEDDDDIDDDDDDDDDDDEDDLEEVDES
jgi:DNA-directed RNA polymerase subunit RPC12/RpoP